MPVSLLTKGVLFALPGSNGAGISLGFASGDTMPSGIQWFAAIQPMTAMIDCISALTVHLPLGDGLWLALAWCVVLSIMSFAVSVKIYNRKSSLMKFGDFHFHVFHAAI